MRAIAWWNGLGRQKRTGWLIIFISVGYMAYFAKTRLFATGPLITNKEWLYFILTFFGVMLGTVNIRMAEMRERNQKTFPPITTKQSAKK
jgi:hypothetical protein